MARICELTADCPFFTRRVCKSNRAIALIRRRFCLAGGCNCARRRVHDMLGEKFVPLVLYPVDHVWADEILTAHRDGGEPVAGCDSAA